MVLAGPADGTASFKARAHYLTQRGSDLIKYLSQLIQNYLDAWTSSIFKTGKDGRKLFFPRGVLGRGYVIASEQDYERLVRQTKALCVVGLVLGIGFTTLGVLLERYLALFIGAAVLLFLYHMAVVPYLVRGMQPSDERLSLKGAYTSEAITLKPAHLWWLEIGLLAGVGVGVVTLIVDPANWLTALALIVLCGFLAAFGMWMIILRRRASGQEAPHS
ncbi:hypothetical protein AUC69_01805 [Methyloceanibacter superfactus]|uniref:Uncharacterized protein n=1 Tax=Methyloceanibacter superfactus TaxID=1774969 RepID=A0A1E3VR37_9HYPH|nr:hypothetical protein AUC69_01805 [Methyloceanibacter superfactus]